MQGEPDGEEVFELSCLAVLVLCLLVSGCVILTGLAVELFAQYRR
jgi:hypothetical protein